MTQAQRRLVNMLIVRGGEEEYWPLFNDWTKGDTKRPFALSLHNINRTFDALRRTGIIELADDGYVRLVPETRA